MGTTQKLRSCTDMLWPWCLFVLGAFMLQSTLAARKTAAEQCPSPPVIEYGRVSGMYYVGDSILYECNPGYVLQGNRKAKCDDQKTWGNSDELGVCVKDTTSRRLSLTGLKAYQSTTLCEDDPACDDPPYWPHLAIDGVVDTNLLNHHCSHTEIRVESPWWAVDLGSIKTLQSVSITNREDCCCDRMSNVRVALTMQEPPYPGPPYDNGFHLDSDTQVCHYETQSNGMWGCGETKKLECYEGGATGRYLVIQQVQMANRPLQLCHVEAVEVI